MSITKLPISGHCFGNMAKMTWCNCACNSAFVKLQSNSSIRFIPEFVTSVILKMRSFSSQVFDLMMLYCCCSIRLCISTTNCSIFSAMPQSNVKLDLPKSYILILNASFFGRIYAFLMILGLQHDVES